jgi:hypothetical protein
MGAGCTFEGFVRGFFGTVPKFGSCGGRYTLLLDGNGRMSHCQNEAEDDDRAMFEEFEDEIEVEGMYAVDEGMPKEFEVECRGEIEGAGTSLRSSIISFSNAEMRSSMLVETNDVLCDDDDEGCEDEGAMSRTNDDLDEFSEWRRCHASMRSLMKRPGILRAGN